MIPPVHLQLEFPPLFWPHGEPGAYP